MDTEPTKPTILPPPPTPAKPATNEAPPDAPTSAWESYLTGKRTAASRFLAMMEAARAKGGLTLPSDATKRRFAEALAAKPERVERLVALMQACGPCSDTVRHIVTEFAEAGIKRLGIVTFPEPPDAAGFSASIAAWLGGPRKKPINPAELNLMFLLLHYAWQRHLLDRDTAFSLISLAVANPAKAPPMKAPPAKPAPTPLEVLLSSAPTLPVLEALLAHSEASKVESEKLNDQVQAQAAEISRLTSECANLNAHIGRLVEEITALKDEKTAAENKIAELEQQIVELRDGYQHKLDDVRGKIRGMLQGKLARWLQTALDASRSDPPWTQAIQERLEDAIRLIEKETQWLQPSA